MKIVGFRPWTASLLIAALAVAATAPAGAKPVKGGDPVVSSGSGNSGGSGGQGNGGAPPGPCSTTDVGPYALGCIGYAQGSQSVPKVGELVDLGSWSGLQGATLVRFDDFEEEADLDNDASTGRLRLLADLNGPFVLTLRGGNDWAGYYFGEGMAAGSVISFDIPVTDADERQSRAAIYTTGPAATRNLEPAPGVIPEPSGLAALIPGLLAIGIGARRRRRG